MGDSENEKKYTLLAEKLRTILKETFWDPAVDGPINRQTLFSTLLFHKVIPEADMDRARDSLLLAVKNGPSSQFNTGIFGTKYILETLSEIASPDEVFKVVNSTAFPGWGHMIDNGATTLWETWKESDNTFTNCHPMFGSVTEWFYRWLGGIRPNPDNPGFKEFILAPRLPDGLDSISCVYHSPYGEIVSKWKKSPEETVHYEMKIPKGSSSHVSLTIGPLQKLSINKKGDGFKPESIEGLESGEFKLEEGEYTIIISSNS